MTLKDIRDNLSRMFAKNRLLENTEVNHVLIEDTLGTIHMDYMLKDQDDSDVIADDGEDDYDDDSELEDWEEGDDESELY